MTGLNGTAVNLSSDAPAYYSCASTAVHICLSLVGVQPCSVIVVPNRVVEFFSRPILLEAIHRSR